MENNINTELLSNIPKAEVESCPVNFFDKICRSCFSCNEITNIFDLVYEQMSLSDIIKTCFAVQIEHNDGLPQNICKWCISELIRSYTFRLQYQQSDVILRNTLNTQSLGNASNFVKTEIVSNEITTFNYEGASRNAEDISDNIESANNAFETDTNCNYDEVDSSIKKEFVPEVKNEENSLPKPIRRPKNKIFICNPCNISFDSYIKLIEHKKQAKHPRPRKHKCQTCDKSFCFNNQLRQHMRTHTKEQPYQCKICLRKFSFRYNLHRHNMIHTGEKPFCCDECGKSFIQAVQLKEHKRVHRGEKKVYSYKRSKPTMKQSTEKFKCNICHHLLSSKQNLKQHSLTHGEKQFLCSECGKCFATAFGLRTHMKVHTGLKPYHCSICTKKFSQQGSLKFHMFVHTGEKPYVCKICSKAFKQRTHLMYHSRLHTGERPFVCLSCGKSFTLKGNFTVHMRTHTGETPYVCDICGKGFYDSSNMKKHKKAHHNAYLNNETAVDS